MDIKNVTMYMRENLDKNYRIEEIAAKFGHTRFYFSRKFKRETGFSAKEFISLLKMEKAIENLLSGKNSIILTQLDSGYESSGSFANIFKKNTGLSPKEYRKKVEKLYNMVIKYRENEELLQESYYEFRHTENYNSLTVNLLYPPDYRSEVTFVGLFKTPVPNHPPVVGKAVNPEKTGNICKLNNIPDGRYWLLACSIEKGSRLLKYFDLKDCLRAKIDSSIDIPIKEMNEFTLNLREAFPEDPPILINLPELVFKVVKGMFK